MGIHLTLIAALVLAADGQPAALVDMVKGADVSCSSTSTLEFIRQEIDAAPQSQRTAAAARIDNALDALGLPTTGAASATGVVQKDLVAAIERAHVQRAQFEVSSKLSKQVLLYATDVVAQGVESVPGAGKLVGVFGSPLLQRGVEYWIDSEIAAASGKLEDRFGQVVQVAAAAHIANGNGTPTAAELGALYQTLLADGLGTDAAERSLIHRELLRISGKYLEAHSAEVADLAKKLKEANDAGATMKATLEKTNADLAALRNEVVATVNDRLDTLATGVARLSKEQADTAKRLDRIEGIVQANTTRIEQLERQAKTFQNDLSSSFAVSGEAQAAALKEPGSSKRRFCRPFLPLGFAEITASRQA